MKEFLSVDSCWKIILLAIFRSDNPLNQIGKETPVPTPSEEKYENVTGLFEGGDYSAKGIFRPEMECRMKSNSPKGYCSVCRNAIKDMIEFYLK